MLWWLGFLAAFAIPMFLDVAIQAYGRAYPGTLRTSIADWGGTLAWVLAAILAVRQLNVARRAAPLLRSIARVAVVLVCGFGAVSLHFIAPCGVRTEYVGAPASQHPGSANAQSSSQASCP